MSVTSAQGKSFDIDKRLIWEAWKQVKQRRGAPGIDERTVEQFEADLEGQLYKLWNRMSSGTYFPSPVKLVEIPKPGSDQPRMLGVPTVYDRVAQTAVAMLLNEVVDPVFHDDSYGYRHGRSALDAVAVCRRRCWESDWVIDLDIKGFFDNVPRDRILAAVAHHTDLPWVRLYVARWLAAPTQQPDGSVVERDRGTPQGAPISPLLSNLFMHCVPCRSCGGLAGESPVGVAAKRPRSWWPAEGEIRPLKRHDKVALGGEQVIGPYERNPVSAS